MASKADFTCIARAFPGTTVAPHFDRTAFKVARIYATLAADGRTANLMYTPDEQQLKCLTAPEAFTPVPNAWGQKGATTVTLANIGVAELTAAVELAWRLTQPKPKTRRKAP